MRRSLGRVSMILSLGLLGCVAALGQTAAPAKDANGTKATQIKGLPGVKDKTGGLLLVDGQNLRFTHQAMKVEVPTTSVEDVITGADSQRMIHGTLGTLTMFAPYGGGRFLSLFRTKLESLTIKYRDTGGGLHGAIFSIEVGKAELLKKDLLAHGAHTSAPESEDTNKVSGAKEQKP